MLVVRLHPRLRGRDSGPHKREGTAACIDLDDKAYVVEQAIAQREVAACDSRALQVDLALAEAVKQGGRVAVYILALVGHRCCMASAEVSGAVWAGIRGRRCYKVTELVGVQYHG